MEYKITVKNADRYYMGYMVGSNKSLPGPIMQEDDAVFYTNDKQHTIITKFLNKFDMDGMRYTVEII